MNKVVDMVSKLSEYIQKRDGVTINNLEADKDQDSESDSDASSTSSENYPGVDLPQLQ